MGPGLAGAGAGRRRPRSTTGPVLDQIFTGIKAGKLGGATYTITLGNGGEKIQFNPSYSLPASVQAAAQKEISGIVDGTITPPQ